MAAPAATSSSSSGGAAGGGNGNALITKFTNVTLLRNHSLVVDDLWLRGSEIIDPAERFWEASGAGRLEAADRVVDGAGLLLAPGYIDLQLNGAFGFDFSNPADMAPASSPDEEDNITKICRGVLPHGVTSIYATIITSSPSTYAQLRPLVKRRQGSGKRGAHILGLHLEGPFITVPGAHPPPLMRPPRGPAADKQRAAVAAATDVQPLSPSPTPSPSPPAVAGASEGIRGLAEVNEVYGGGGGNSSDNDSSSSSNAMPWTEEVGIITLAPEIKGIDEVISTLSSAPYNIVISAGHSKASYAQSVSSMRLGARLVTHLFNAMVSFHHRDPGLIGLIGAPEATRDEPLKEVMQAEAEAAKMKKALAAQQQQEQAGILNTRGSHVRVEPTPSSLHHPAPPALFYSLIVDGHHTHPASIKMAFRTHPRGAVLVTDAMLAMGLEDGDYRFGEISVEIKDQMAHVAGTNTLAGSQCE
jgi:N-acetylglucosamine-6-phosphate deacetylase